MSGRPFTSLGCAILTAAAVTAAVAVAAPAQAATPGVAKLYAATKVEYRAGSATANRVVVTRVGRVITIDDRVRVKAGKGCRAVKGDITKVRCTTARTPTWLRVYTGAKNDVVVNNTDLGMTVRAGSGNNTILGGPRNDQLFASEGHDKIYGRGGPDYIYPSGGNDVVDGGAGEDTLHGGDGGDKLFGGPGNDRLDGGDGNDVARGGADDDMFDESLGRDVLFGDAGSDNFHQRHADVGEPAAEDIRGGPGHDAVYYDTRAKAITADPDGRRGDDGQRGEGDTIGIDVESIAGGAGNDTLTGGPGHNSLSGGEGHDRLSGLGGDDLLYGEVGNDRLYGGAGNDNLDGGFGTDVMGGGSGVDHVSYGERLVTVVADLDGQVGDDGSRGERDTIGSDVENLYGGWGNDVLTGNRAANVIYGAHGADVIRGGAGNDELSGDEGVKGGIDRVYGEAGDDVLTGNPYGKTYGYLLDGGPNATAVGDSCTIYYPGSGDVVNCERTEG